MGPPKTKKKSLKKKTTKTKPMGIKKKKKEKSAGEEKGSSSSASTRMTSYATSDLSLLTGKNKTLAKETMSKLKEHLDERRDRQRVSLLLQERLDLQDLVDKGKLTTTEADSIIVEKAALTHGTGAHEEEVDERTEEEKAAEEALARKAAAVAAATLKRANAFDPYAGSSSDMKGSAVSDLVPCKVR